MATAVSSGDYSSDSDDSDLEDVGEVEELGDDALADVLTALCEVR